MCLDADLALLHRQNRARRGWLGRGDNALTIFLRSSGPLPESGRLSMHGAHGMIHGVTATWTLLDCLPINSAMTPSAPLPHHYTSPGQPSPLDPHSKPPTHIYSTGILASKQCQHAHICRLNLRVDKATNRDPGPRSFCHGPEHEMNIIVMVLV